MIEPDNLERPKIVILNSYKFQIVRLKTPNYSTFKIFK